MAGQIPLWPSRRTEGTLSSMHERDRISGPIRIGRRDHPPCGGIGGKIVAPQARAGYPCVSVCIRGWRIAANWRKRPDGPAAPVLLHFQSP